MRRVRPPVLLLVLASLGGAACFSPPPPAPLEAPNVVMILVDDLGWGDVNYHGGEIGTPVLDRLASEGVRLERFYAAPSCSPSRAGILTGKSPARLGFLRNTMDRDTYGLPLEERTMAEGFRDAGFATALVGKWHLGQSQPEQLPPARGFDHFYGFLGGWVRYWDHGRARRIDWQRNGEPLEESGFTTHLLTDEAIRLIEERDRTRPLFLLLAYNAPHAPLALPPGETAESLGMNTPPGQPLRTIDRPLLYAATVRDLDAEIGRFLACLDDEGITEETIVFFASDNGATPAWGASNRPLRGEKYTVWEGGVRTPAIVRWPGHVVAGEESEDIVSHVDLWPTLAAAAGVAWDREQVVDGRDRWSAIVEAGITPRERLVFGARKDEVSRWAVLDGSRKLVEELPDAGEGSAMLFDVHADEGETIDLAERNSAEVDELRRELEAWKRVPLLGGE